jgi:hypothetical protein
MTTTINASSSGSGGLIQTADASGILALQTAGTTAITVDASQNVGVGTASPVAKFAIVGGTTNASNLATAYSTAAFNITPKSSSGYSLAFGSGLNDRPYIQMSAAGTAPNDIMIQPYGGSLGIGTTVNNVYDQVAAPRPLVVQLSDTSTTVNGSNAAITIVNGDTTTNNTAQLNFAAITGASTNQYSSAIISAIFGARTNAQYPTGQLVFATSTSLNSAPSEKIRIDSGGNLKLSTAGTKILNSSGNPIVQQTGSILQVVSTTKTDTFSTATTGSYVDITGLSVSITPTSSTSKILIHYSVCVGPADVLSIQLVRNSTAICLGDAATGSIFQATAGGVAVVNGDKVFPIAGNFLDSPATTSATTYKIQMRNYVGTSYVNRTPNDSNAVYTARSTSTITVMEIAA